MPPTSGIITASLYGVTPGRDSWAALQAIHDGLTGVAAVTLPPGRIPVSRPFSVERDGLTLAGAGPGLTELCPTDGGTWPPVVVGVPRTANGRTVRPAHRPDAFGLLDSTIAPKSGAWAGFASDSDAFLCVPSCPGVYRDGAWDGWTDPRGYTVEVAVWLPNGVQGLAGTTVVGLGGADRPGPWYVGIDGNKAWCLRFKTADQSSDPNTVACDGRNTFDTRGLARVRVVFDNPHGQAWLDINDQRVVTVAYPPGSRFGRPRGHLPLWIGPSPSGEVIDRSAGTVPPLTVLACRVSVGVRPDAGNDAGRYKPPASGPHDGVTVLALDGTSTAPARHLPVYQWPGPDGWTRGVAWVGQRGTEGWVKGVTIRDLKVTHGPLALGSVLDFRAERVEATGGAVGLASVPQGASYPIDVRDSRFGGSDTAVGLSWAICRLSNVDLTAGGSTHTRLAGCGGYWRGGVFGGEGTAPLVGLDLIGADYGGVWSLSDLILDNESRAYAVAGVRMDRHLMTRLDVSNVVVGLVGPGAVAVLLRGDTPPKQDVPVARLSGLGAWSGDPGVRVDGSGWRVSVDGQAVAPINAQAPKR